MATVEFSVLAPFRYGGKDLVVGDVVSLDDEDPITLGLIEQDLIGDLDPGLTPPSPPDYLGLFDDLVATESLNATMAIAADPNKPYGPAVGIHYANAQSHLNWLCAEQRDGRSFTASRQTLLVQSLQAMLAAMSGDAARPGVVESLNDLFDIHSIEAEFA